MLTTNFDFKSSEVHQKSPEISNVVQAQQIMVDMQQIWSEWEH